MEDVKKKDPQWKFKMIRDSKNGFLVEMDTFRGRRKSEMDFLIAILLQKCLKLISNETGEKVNELEVEFKVPDNEDNLTFKFLKAAERIDIKLLFV